MSKTTRWVFLLLLMMGFSVSSWAGSLTLRMAYIDTDAVPFKWKENGNGVGPIMDIMAETARRSGVDAVFVPLPAKRIDAYLAAGKIDGAFGLSRRGSRDRIAVFFDPPIGLLDAHLFVVRGNEFPFTKIEDLFGRTIGGVRGLVFGNEFDAGVAAGKIILEDASTYEALLKKLVWGRVNIVASPTPVLQYHIAKMGLTDEVVKLPHPLRPIFGLHIVVSKASETYKKPELMEKMAAAVQAMGRENRFDAIYKGYGYTYNTPEE
ncbi:MAG: ABC transporter substrate-binding protein [Desulfobacterales bacterium]|nr:ABC transporter substrate-binding protein [Desulfobacterales bacterium]